MVLGSADYIAPEQIDNPHAADIRADIYGLGCTLYFLLAGRPPFPDGSLIEKLTAHAEKTPRPLAEIRADVPPELATVVSRMIAEDQASGSRHRRGRPSGWRAFVDVRAGRTAATDVGAPAIARAPTASADFPPLAPAVNDPQPAPRATRFREQRPWMRIAAPVAAP